MTYVGLASADGGGIGMRRACTECGAAVEPVGRGDDQHDPAYCASCGHKFRQVQQEFSAAELVALLNEATAQTAVDAREEQP